MKLSELRVERHFVDLASLRMHYVAAGEGPTVVLLHGFPETWWSWRHQIGPLREAGFRVVVPDLRGYGDTDKHGPYDVATVSLDVRQLIESLGSGAPAAVVGHDWGGATAWHFAAHHAALCPRLVVMNCPHPVAMQRALVARPKWAQVKKSWYMFFFQVPGVPEWLMRRDEGGAIARMIKSVSVGRDHCTREELAPFLENVQRPGAATAMLGWYRDNIRAGLRHPFRPTPYPTITVPTLLIWGMEDPALGFDDVVPGSELYAPKLEIARVEGCGHFVQSEQPRAVNDALISFVKRPLTP